MWQTFCSGKISWDFAVLRKVIMKGGRFMVVDSSEGDRRVAVICLTLIMSKPRLTRQSDMSSAEVLCVRWQVSYHRLHGFLDLG
jgi:hypothetical protein